MTTSGRVFVVQNQHYWDTGRGELLPKFDMTPAKEYGTLEFLLSPSASPSSSRIILGDLKTKLKTFNDKDHLLLVGNPVLIMMTGIIAASYNQGRVAALQWSGRDQRYFRISLDNLLP